MKTFVTDDTLLTFVCQCKLPNLITMYCNHWLYSNHSTSYLKHPWLRSFPAKEGSIKKHQNFPIPPDCLHLAVVGGLAGLNDLTGYAGGNFVLGRASQAGQAGRERPD